LSRALGRTCTRVDIDEETTTRDHNAEETTRLIRWGRVMGLLEAGVVLGFWSAKARDRASEQVHYRYALHRLPRTLAKKTAGPEGPAAS
jgi:hypothetical protein